MSTRKSNPLSAFSDGNDCANAIRAIRSADKSSEKSTTLGENHGKAKMRENVGGSTSRNQTSGLLPPIDLNSPSSEVSTKSNRECKGKNKNKSRYHSTCTIPSDFWRISKKPSTTNKSKNDHKEQTRSKSTSRHIIKCKMNRDSVAAYINENQDFLDEYIDHNVPVETIERWLARKASRESNNLQSNKESGISRRKFCVHENKRKMLQEITDSVKEYLSHEQVLWELGRCISSAVGVDGFRVYQVTFAEQINIQLLIDLEVTKQVKLMPIASSEAPFVEQVARLGQPFRLNRARDSETFKRPICSQPNAESVLYQPIIKPNNETSAVLEMWRVRSGFCDEDEETSSSYLMWGSIALHYAQLYLDINKQRVLTDFLLDVVKSIFQDMVCIEAVVRKVMNFAQKLVGADRASLFLVDDKRKELYATVFDLVIECEEQGAPGSGQSVSKLSSIKEVRFPLGTGIAGHVAETGEVLNIEDAYADNRFNRAVDKITGYKTKTILCMPIYSRNSIIGVVQMVNKRGGPFTKEDEKAFEMFAVYCGLAINHAKLYNRIKRSEQKYKVALDVLSYHNTCTEEEVKMFLNDIVPTVVVGIDEFSFDVFRSSDYEKAKLTIYMFTDLFGLDEFDRNSLVKFVMTVKKNYRRVPYHNWCHGFSVANSMYNILKRTHVFSRNERIALFIASVCHDLDHRGKNNKFMYESASPLAAMYSTSTMEHHHFNHSVTILHQEGHNIFSKLSSSDFREVLELMRHCILATDLALFFPNKDHLQRLLENNQFQWDDINHRRSLLAISMTAADLCASAKPWDVHVQTVKVIFQEFYEQGDAEREAGREPIEMMDRRRPEKQASNQVGFLSGICIICYELLQKLIPEIRPALDMCLNNLERWKRIDDEVKEAVKGVEEEWLIYTCLPKELKGILEDLL